MVRNRRKLLAITLGLSLSITGLQIYRSGSTGGAMGAETTVSAPIVCSNNATGALRIRTSGTCNKSTEKLFNFTIQAPEVVDGFISQSVCGKDGISICHIGAIGPSGGVIYFVDYNNIYPNFTYLEVAPSGWNGGNELNDPSSTWCSNVTQRIQNSADSWSTRTVGSGRTNTLAMREGCNEGAIKLLDKYLTSSRTTFRDWFLPSLGELILLSRNLQGLAGLSASEYWSSSEYTDVGAWVSSVGAGYQGSANKATNFKIRPVRSF
ncbi:MAG: hypothetical protein F2814_05875 [Actinobacteria bacterium]|nr:hypothetical protein [Actinomycetota bacterium]